MKAKRAILILIAVLILISIPLSSAAAATYTGRWKKDSKGWWFSFDHGGYAKNMWGQISGKWYFFKNNGYMATGWTKVGNTWYYMDKSSGAMYSNRWLNDGGSWYWLKGSGAMASNEWIQTGGKWYYLYSGGKMARNTTIGGYKLDSSGAWVQGGGGGATARQKQAVQDAKIELWTAAFSRNGLLNDLISIYGYTKAEATYGVDNCGANWYEQARRYISEWVEVEYYSSAYIYSEMVQEALFTADQAISALKYHGIYY